MAYYGGGYGVPSGGSVFGGYSGGFTQTPGGFILPPNTNALGVGYSPAPGTYLPNVDPNTYPGTVHFGPSTTVIGPQSVLPFSTGYTDPYLNIGGAANFNGEF